MQQLSLAAAETPSLDWQAALSRMGGKHSLLRKMIILFQGQASQLLAEMADAFSQDASTLERSAHTLKSSANSIGAFALAEILQQLETSSHEGALSEVELQYGLLATSPDKTCACPPRFFEPISRVKTGFSRPEDFLDSKKSLLILYPIIYASGCYHSIGFEFCIG